MKLLCLNTWGGKQGQILFDFLAEQAKDTDIFCFQEVFHAPESLAQRDSRGGRVHLFEELTELLLDFTGWFAPVSKNHDLAGPIDLPITQGLAIFVKKPLPMSEQTVVPTLGRLDDPIGSNFETIPRALQHIVAKGQLHIYNFHGIPEPGNKLDTPDRLAQSEKILQVMGKTGGPKILCGDFNLLPETESIGMLGKDYENLITTYRIKSTRNKISWTKFKSHQSYADYTFVSPEIKVKNFLVPYNEISDHLPMILEFKLDSVDSNV